MIVTFGKATARVALGIEFIGKGNIVQIHHQLEFESVANDVFKNQESFMSSEFMSAHDGRLT